MRFWSLNTATAICFQGVVFHPSVVVQPCSELLDSSLDLSLPNSRAHVSVSFGFPKGLCFLSHPSTGPFAVATCSRGRTLARGELPRVTPFLTVPEALRPFCRSHPTLAYQAMFKASSEARKRLAQDSRFIGTTLPGFPGILHTWGRQLQYHPHIHSIVPGGGLSHNRNAWLPSRAHFSVPVRALSPLYRAIFAEEMRKAGQLEQIAPQVWATPWNVPRQAHPNGDTSFTYLAPYVFKVAISNRRIVGLKERTVTFTSRKPGSARPRTTSLDVLECIRRFLQHVLPAGFMKVRHFGFLHASCPIKTDTNRPLITQQPGTLLARPHTTANPSAAVACPNCGAQLLVVTRGLPWQTAFCDTG
jgi:hypothetical protein